MLVQASLVFLNFLPLASKPYGKKEFSSSQGDGFIGFCENYFPTGSENFVMAVVESNFPTFS